MLHLCNKSNIILLLLMLSDLDSLKWNTRKNIHPFSVAIKERYFCEALRSVFTYRLNIQGAKFTWIFLKIALPAFSERQILDKRGELSYSNCWYEDHRMITYSSWVILTTLVYLTARMQNKPGQVSSTCSPLEYVFLEKSVKLQEVLGVWIYTNVLELGHQWIFAYFSGLFVL